MFVRVCVCVMSVNDRTLEHIQYTHIILLDQILLKVKRAKFNQPYKNIFSSILTEHMVQQPTSKIFPLEKRTKCFMAVNSCEWYEWKRRRCREKTRNGEWIGGAGDYAEKLAGQLYGGLI